MRLVDFPFFSKKKKREENLDAYAFFYNLQGSKREKSKRSQRTLSLFFPG